MTKFKIKYRFRCENGVVYNIESDWKEAPHKDYYFEHLATVEAMNILLSKADELKEGNKKLIDFNIIWEE